MAGKLLQTILGEAPVLSDGGMGTSLVDRGVSPGASMEALNLDAPAVVAGVHQAFVDAGAQFVETNTFAANRYKLASFGLADRIADINRAGVEIARAVASVVGGSVGPLGVHLAPYGRVRPEQAREAYAEQVAALAAAGVDLLCIETQSDLGEIEQALAAARDVCDLPVIVTATFTRDDRTPLGSTPSQVAARLVELGADAIGVNCAQGPAQVLRLIKAMRQAAGETPLVARPNAGGPVQVAGRLMYPATPEYFGEQARALVAAGASIVGGCCGTGPEHIRAMAEALAAGVPVPVAVPLAQPLVAEAPSVEGGRSELGSALDEGRFVVAVEMDPPRSSSAEHLLAGATTLADAGADVITVADSPMARMRMSPWAACSLVQERVGIETVLSFPTRGRNILRIQGDLLAAHALGIRNVFVCLGDPTSIGDYPDATSNVDVAPTGLIKLVAQSFNAGSDQVGASIGEATGFVVGCALNLGSSDLDRECALLQRKIRSGADFAMTQPIYDLAVLERFREAYERRHGPLSLPLLVGILPPISERHAAFLHNEVPGIEIPEALRERLRLAGARASEEGVLLATELAQRLGDLAAGMYLMPPFGRYDLAAELVEAATSRRGRAARAI
jgi:homocysteine S-methyltransferase